MYGHPFPCILHCLWFLTISGLYCGLHVQSLLPSLDLHHSYLRKVAVEQN